MCLKYFWNLLKISFLVVSNDNINDNSYYVLGISINWDNIIGIYKKSMSIYRRVFREKQTSLQVPHSR